MSLWRGHARVSQLQQLLPLNFPCRSRGLISGGLVDQPCCERESGLWVAKFSTCYIAWSKDYPIHAGEYNDKRLGYASLVLQIELRLSVKRKETPLIVSSTYAGFYLEVSTSVFSGVYCQLSMHRVTTLSNLC